MRRGIAVYLACLIAGTLFAGAEGPVISVEPMLDHIGWYLSHKAYTFQTRLTAELFTRYSCLPVARGIGLALQRERSLAALEKRLDAMPAPDWIIGGSYQIGRKMSGGWSETDIELLLVDSASGAPRREVFREKAGHYDEVRFIADTVAGKLHLRPRGEYRGPAPERREETWAVLPFVKIIQAADFDRARSFHESDLFCYLLQRSGKIGNVVSREDMRKLMEEHRFRSMTRVNLGTAAEFGRLLAADRIVYGMITDGPVKGQMRLDILLISSESGAVVNAFSGVFAPEKQEEFFADTVRHLLSVPDAPPPRSGPAPDWRHADAESERLMTAISGAGSHWRDNPVLTAQIIDLAESYYLLNANFPYRCLRLCHETVNNLFRSGCPEDWELRNSRKSVSAPPVLITTAEQSEALADFLLPILDRLTTFRLLEYPASNGKLRFRLLLNAGRFEEAEEIYRKKLYGAADISESDMASLEMCRKRFKTGGDMFLADGDFSRAVYAYDLAGDKDSAYRAGCRQTPLFLPRSPEVAMIYLELLEERESATAALKWFDACCKYGDEHPGKGLSWRTRVNKRLSARIDRLRARVAPMKFYPVRDLFDACRAYPVYFQGLGGIPAGELQTAAALLEENTGLSAVILPDRKLPVQGVYSAGLHAFDAEKLCRAVRYAWGKEFPDTGLLMLCITNDAVAEEGTKVLYHDAHATALAVFSRMLIAGEKVDFSRTLAITAARLALYKTMREPVWCSNYPCIFVAVNQLRRCGEFEFKICAECREKAVRGNPKRALMRFRNQNWINYCSDEEIRQFELYKKEFRK